MIAVTEVGEEGGWWKGVLGGVEGTFPVTYVELSEGGGGAAGALLRRRRHWPRRKRARPARWPWGARW